MRTTVDIPDDLLRRAKIRAAERGVRLRDVFTAGLEKELAVSADEPRKRGTHRPLPVVIPEGRLESIPRMTNAEIFELLDREEDFAKGRIVE